ncbi:hypothetical protein B0I35DRAFT_443266 [Stachybotrys elegans]|uniref:Amine oxidase domain-containing protein n=1 Tax=Stachybotrys elegans TaxID=80388 RepID=A0A8K0SH17_9HYPO|nr:hypothetical protein B0I35DRAFT_443266 [Stachybotrys elegans]
MDRTEPRVKPPHIGIIGAGVSGLQCANILLEQGFRVTILEARDRVGGRICQSDKLGYTVDLGPNWIHASDGPEVNPMLRIATQTSTPLHRWNDKQLIFDSHGQPIDENISDRLSTILWDVIEEAFSFSSAAGEEGNPDIDANMSLHDYIKLKAVEKLPSEDERAMLLRMSEMFGAYIGEPIHRQSLKFAWMEECCGGDELFVESNYSSILEAVAKPALSHANIKLDTYVERIHATEGGSSQKQVELTTKQGELFHFDEVVVSAPLGWLKKHHDAFDPKLPPPILSAISNIGLSQLEKVFITFPTAFWNDELDKDNSICFANWLTPDYTPDTNPSGWPQEIWNLASFREPNRHPTLLFYTYGDCSRHIVNSIKDMSPEDEFRFLNQFFLPHYSRLPGFAKELPDCQPRRILASKWLLDELNGNASYCNFPVGITNADQDVLAFREGCPDRHLWFCGEHAAPFDECGTAAGAYLSGEHAGKAIVARYQNSQAGPAA